MAQSTWPDGELSAAGKLDTWPARREARYRCGQGDRARAMRSGRCGRGDAAKAMRPGRCGSGDAAQAIAQVERPGGTVLRGNGISQTLKKQRKSTTKSVQSQSRWVVWGTMEPARNAIGTQERHEAAPGASRERLGASLERPSRAQRVPEVAPGHPKERPGTSGSVPRRRKSRLSRTWDGQHRAWAICP